MDFPGNILDRISRLFDDSSDDILIYVLIFLFVFFAEQPGGRDPDDPRRMDGSIPVIIIAVFLILFLFIGAGRGQSARQEI